MDENSVERIPTKAHTRRRAMVKAGLVVTASAGLLAGGVALASSGPGAIPSVSTSVGDDAGLTRGLGMHRGRGHGPATMGLPGPMGAIHGELVGPDGAGGYRTYLTQVGKVTAVDTGSISVRSDDGYTRTYSVTSTTVVDAGRDGISDVSVGDTVHLMARGAEGKDVVLHLVDLSRLRDTWRDLHPGGRPGTMG